MIDKVRHDSLGLIYENLANVNRLADYWQRKAPCSPAYIPKSAPYIGHQIPRTSKLLLATRIIVQYLRLKQGLDRFYMPYLNPVESIMTMQVAMRPPTDLPNIQVYFGKMGL